MKSPVRDGAGDIVGVQAVFWDVTAARKAEAALENIRQAVPDMVLLDVRLPGMSGIEALREIRKLELEGRLEGPTSVVGAVWPPVIP